MSDQFSDASVEVLEGKLSEVIQALDLSVSVQERELDGKDLYFNLSGDDSEHFLNHKAEPVKSLAFLLQTWADQEYGEDQVVIKVDAEGQLARREAQLREMAEQACDKLHSIGEQVKLEPLNPYERRQIHMILQEREGFETESVGHGVFKNVIIRRIG